MDVAIVGAGRIGGKVVVDTTNQFGSGPMPGAGQTAAAFNAARMPGSRYTKSFNTLTAAFQAQVAHRAILRRPLCRFCWGRAPWDSLSPTRCHAVIDVTSAPCLQISRWTKAGPTTTACPVIPSTRCLPPGRRADPSSTSHPSE